MCETSAIVDHELVVAARHASDLILGRYLQVPVAKAMNLGTPRGFDLAVAELAAALRSRTAAPDADAVRSVVGILDVDWLGTTAEQRRNLIAQAMQAAGRITSAVPRTVETVFGPAADEVVDATRTAARRGQRLNIAADFNALDRRIVEHLRTSQTTYVRDEYGRRNAAFGERARTIVADGLESGLGRDDIAGDLQAAAEGILTGRGQFYWEVVAGSFVSQGRSFAQLSAYAEAGIDRYLIEAVLDERTTEVCRFLHGKSFTVGAGLRTFERMEADPESVPAVAPWVREAVDPDTGRKVLFVDSGGQRTAVAEVTRSGFGSRDDRGEFGRSLSEQQLLDLGISFPPYHGLCRTTTVADVRYLSPKPWSLALPLRRSSLGQGTCIDRASGRRRKRAESDPRAGPRAREASARQALARGGRRAAEGGRVAGARAHGARRKSSDDFRGALAARPQQPAR